MGSSRPLSGLEGDILLHQTCVRQSGFRTAYEGARVVCEAVQGPRGLQARRLISLDNSTAQVMPQAEPRMPRYTAEPTGEPFDATSNGSTAARATASCRAVPARGRLRPHGNAAPLEYPRAAPGPAGCGSAQGKAQRASLRPRSQSSILRPQPASGYSPCPTSRRVSARSAPKRRIGRRCWRRFPRGMCSATTPPIPAFHGCIDWHSACHAVWALLAIAA